MNGITLAPELIRSVKALRLSGILDILPERIRYAKEKTVSHHDFLEMVLRDETDRRNSTALNRKLHNARLNLNETPERFDWDANITIDRAAVTRLFNNSYIERHEGVLFFGPAGVGKTYLANALGHAACRNGYPVLLYRADQLFKLLLQSRADLSYEKEIHRLIHTDLLIIDDFGLRALNEVQATDFYEVIIERYARRSTVITSNRMIDEWLDLFPDKILANSAMDRIAHNAHQIVIEGDSYRKKQSVKSRV